jgi:hypothetical protein
MRGPRRTALLRRGVAGSTTDTLVDAFTRRSSASPTVPETAAALGAHLQFGADDIAYDGDEAFHKLPPGRAMNNADTYSEFVQETHGMF